MSRITDYILEPKVVYTDGGFLVRVKVIDDYKYKKYIVSENLHYKTVQGTSFTLTDASSTKQASITEIKGNTSQEGTPTPSSPVEVKTVSGDNNVVVSNKNFWDNIENQTLSTNVEIVKQHFTIKQRYNYAKTMTINNNELSGKPSENTGTYYLWDFTIKDLRPNTTYTLSYKIDMSGVTGTASSTYFFGEAISIENMTGRQRTLTFTTDENGNRNVGTSDAQKRLITLPTNQTDLIFRLYDIQLEQGNQATTYIAHQGNSYRVDLKGKNLFNDILRQGVTTYNTGVWGNTYTRITSTVWITNIKAGTYTINANTSTTKTLQVSMVTFDTNGNFYNVSGVSGQWKTMPFTFTIPVDMQLKCNISYTDGSNITPSEVTEMQLESGTQATEYSPSNPIELCKIGNYQDKLYYDSGKWYVEKQVGKVVLGGSETWGGGNSSSGSPNYTYVYTNAIDSYVKSGYYGALSDKLVNLNADMQTTSVVSTDTLGVSSTVTYKLRIMVLTSRLGTANTSGFKTWLGSNNITVYYVLATPTYTEITDTYLLNQLNGLLDIELYEDLCYVDWVGIEKPTMSLLYAGTEDLGIKYIITEDGKKIRTDWRKLGRRKKWKMK